MKKVKIKATDIATETAAETTTIINGNIFICMQIFDDNMFNRIFKKVAAANKQAKKIWLR